MFLADLQNRLFLSRMEMYTCKFNSVFLLQENKLLFILNIDRLD